MLGADIFTLKHWIRPATLRIAVNGNVSNNNMWISSQLQPHTHIIVDSNGNFFQLDLRIVSTVGLPSGKLSQNYGKSPFWMGKSTISMVIFQCNKLPEGRCSAMKGWSSIPCSDRAWQVGSNWAKTRAFNGSPKDYVQMISGCNPHASIGP